MTELAHAVFAAARDAHPVDHDTRSRHFAAFKASFDEAAYRRDLERRGLRWLARSDPAFPPRLRSIHDPPRMAVRFGAFDGDPGVRPSHRQFVAYAAPWEPIPDDGLPRFSERRTA